MKNLPRTLTARPKTIKCTNIFIFSFSLCILTIPQVKTWFFQLAVTFLNVRGKGKKKHYLKLFRKIKRKLNFYLSRKIKQVWWPWQLNLEPQKISTSWLVGFFFFFFTLYLSFLYNYLKLKKSWRNQKFYEVIFCLFFNEVTKIWNVFKSLYKWQECQ